MLLTGYKSKKELKASVGKALSYQETSMFGAEFTPNGKFAVVGPDPHNNRKWYASVTMVDGLIAKVT